MSLIFAFTSARELSAEPTIQKIVSSRSHVQFESNSPALPVSGSFHRYTGQVEVDPQTHELLRVAFNIDLSNPQLKNAAPQFIWLAQGLLQGLEAPIAKFQSTSVSRLGADRIEARGLLQLGNKRDDLTIPIKILTISNEASRFSGTLQGSITPQQFARLDGALNFDLWFAP